MFFLPHTNLNIQSNSLFFARILFYCIKGGFIYNINQCISAEIPRTIEGELWLSGGFLFSLENGGFEEVASCEYLRREGIRAVNESLQTCLARRAWLKYSRS